MPPGNEKGCRLNLEGIGQNNATYGHQDHRVLVQ